uniref:Uncharacterized protein n=1 Tax=Romanomermis culicivorax TaxID=13658 RepID=A0A915J872_ROMCU
MSKANTLADSQEKAKLDNKEMEELTLWSDDQLKNMEIYDCCETHHLLSDAEAMVALDLILRALKFGDGIDSLGQYLVATCLYGTRRLGDLSEHLYIFDKAFYPKAKFANAADFKSILIKSEIPVNNDNLQELEEYYDVLDYTFDRSAPGLKAAYIGFVAGVLMRSAVKKPSAVLKHIESKMNKNFSSLYNFDWSPPILPVTELDLALIQTKMAPPCLWTNTLMFYSVGSHEFYSSMDDAKRNWNVFDAMHNLHFKYCRLGLVPLCIKVMRERCRNSFDKFYDDLTCPEVEQGLKLLRIFFAAYHSNNKYFSVDFKCEPIIAKIPPNILENRSIYFPYCRIFDPNFFNQLDGANHPPLKMLLLALSSGDENFCKSHSLSTSNIHHQLLENVLNRIKLRLRRDYEEFVENFHFDDEFLKLLDSFWMQC